MVADLCSFSKVSFYTVASFSICCNHALEVYKFSVNGVAEFLVKGNTTSMQEYDWLEFISPLLARVAPMDRCSCILMGMDPPAQLS
ncbi:hypothetical protein M0R45_000454 [Rubus argutus]|uniref:Uncharacterized protein n=1 Tax=Rubus argutus TaxID=59490 RepID=A0AAW1VMS6_RUBAR